MVSVLIVKYLGNKISPQFSSIIIKTLNGLQLNSSVFFSAFLEHILCVLGKKRRNILNIVHFIQKGRTGISGHFNP